MEVVGTDLILQYFDHAQISKNSTITALVVMVSTSLEPKRNT